MKKIIGAVVAGMFLLAGAAMAGTTGFPAVGEWQGNQSQYYNSYNFQGTTDSHTKTYTNTNEITFTKYNQQNSNYNTHTNDVTAVKSFSISDVKTTGNLQNQGLSMGQTASNESIANPIYGVAGTIDLFPLVGINVTGAAGAGASGNQGQTIAAANVQFNGNLNLAGHEDSKADFYFHKDTGLATVGEVTKTNVDVNVLKASAGLDVSGWGLKGIVAGGALSIDDPAWIAGGVVKGYAYDKQITGDLLVKDVTVDKDSLAWNALGAVFTNVAGGTSESSNWSFNGHIDYQNQVGGGASWQESATCAGIGCSN